MMPCAAMTRHLAHLDTDASQSRSDLFCLRFLVFIEKLQCRLAGGAADGTRHDAPRCDDVSHGHRYRDHPTSRCFFLSHKVFMVLQGHWRRCRLAAT